MRVLPVGHLLVDYRVEGVLGHGGFGITYLATDLMLHRRVAIKEYFPREFAHRDGTLTVRPSGSAEEKDTFAWGLDRFLHEARLLARFDHPNIVSVTRFFEAHGTAYLVMDYCEGEPLDVIIERNGPIDFVDFEKMLWPMLDALERVHDSGLLHRDIKPANIFIREDGTPVLLDFGAARQEILGHSRSVTSLVTPAYSAFEQYSTHGRQGPWSDIYSLGATFYRAVTGVKLQDAPDRMLDDRVEPVGLIAKTRFPQAILQAIDAALVVRPEGRPQSVATWRKIFKGIDSSTQRRVDALADFTREVPGKSSLSPTTASKRKQIYIAVGLLSALLLIIWGVSGESDSTQLDASSTKPTPVRVPPVAKNDAGTTIPKSDPAPNAEKPAPVPNDRPTQGGSSSRSGEACIGSDSKNYNDCIGQVTFPNGDRYAGSFRNGKPEGRGTVTYSTGMIYVGEVKGGIPHGQGKVTSKDGDSYTGGFVSGLRSGKGRYVWAAGDIFEGTYVAGKPNGPGVYKWKNGDVLEAVYKDGVAQNPQRLKFASGSTYYGELNSDGVLEGTGTYTFSSGNRYVGEYRAGKRNGRGVEYNSSGEITRSGIWKDGELVSSDSKAVSPRSSSNWFNSPTAVVSRSQGNDSEIMQICRASANALKATFPKKLDNVTTAVDAYCIYTARGSMLVYKNTASVDLGSDPQTRSKTHKAVFESHRKGWCAKGDMRETIRQLDVEYHYYNPSLSELLLVVTLNDGECRKIGL